MKKQLEFMGRPIFVSTPNLSMTDQVCEILIEEIQSGHWRVGERLPSIVALAAQSGLGRAPIQQAFERLRQAGYILQEGRAGTFLKAIYPNGVPAKGTIGLPVGCHAASGAWTPDLYDDYRLRLLLEAAARRGYQTQVKYLQSDDDWRRVDKVGEVFGPDVKGIISFHLFRHIPPEILDADTIPLVHLGSENLDCLPMVVGDTYLGFLEATRRIIEAGHRQILVIVDPAENEWENSKRLLAFQDALRGEGLEPDLAAAERSLTLQPQDLRGIRAFLEAHAAATAILCMRSSIEPQLLAMIQMLGIRIPEDLSFVAHGQQFRASGNTPNITHLHYDDERLVESCFNLLEEQIVTRKCPVTRILVRPRFIAGSSLGPPRLHPGRVKGGRKTPPSSIH